MLTEVTTEQKRRAVGIHDLFQTLQCGDVYELRKQLKRYNGSLQRAVRGSTLLGKAVELNHLAAVNLLLECGAPIDYRNQDHLHRVETPLIMACRLGHEEIAKVLLKTGASVHEKDYYGRTALAIAIQEQRHVLVDLLLQNGSPINYSNGARNPFNAVMEFINYKGRRNMALLLAAAGLPVDQTDAKGVVPLAAALYHKDLCFARFLVELGAKLSNDLWSTFSDESQTGVEVKSFVRIELGSPPPLSRLCRISIRNHLRRTFEKDIRPAIRLLSLPPPAKKFLLLENELASAGITALCETH